MDQNKLAKIKAAGFGVTTTKDWLGLTPEEEKLVDMRVALAEELERVRIKKGLTQTQLADKLGTRQSGVARMIKRPDTSTMDNLIKGLLTLGEPISKIAACLLLCPSANP